MNNIDSINSAGVTDFAVIHAGEGGDLEAVVAAQERALAEASR